MTNPLLGGSRVSRVLVCVWKGGEGANLLLDLFIIILIILTRILFLVPVLPPFLFPLLLACV